MMRHKGIRTTLFIIETFIGLGALYGGIAILTGAFSQWLPMGFLQGSPFCDYSIPGLVLTIVLGGGMLLVATTIFIRHEWAVLVSMGMGIVLIGWIAVEVAIIDRNPQAIVPPTVVQQILFPVLGLVMICLATFLWMTEYRSQSFLNRHVGHDRV